MSRYSATAHLILLPLTFLSDADLIDILQRYSFVRFHGLEGDDIEEKLERMFNANLSASDAIPNVGELIDGSYGMLVLCDYIPTLREIMAALFPGSTMDSEYHPLQPSETDIRRGDCSSAKIYMEWFDQRMRSCASDVGEDFYEGLKLLDSQHPGQLTFASDLSVHLLTWLYRCNDTCRTADSDFSSSSARDFTEFGNNEDSSMTSFTGDDQDDVETSEDEDN